MFKVKLQQFLLQKCCVEPFAFFVFQQSVTARAKEEGFVPSLIYVFAHILTRGVRVMRGPHSTHGLPQFLKVILILLGDARVPRGICTRPLIRTGIFYRVSVRTVLLGIATLSGKSR